MALIFKITNPLGPFKFVNTSVSPPPYYLTKPFDGAFASEQVKDYEDSKCYLQKWLPQDRTKIQFFSDFPSITIGAYRFGTTQQTHILSPVLLPITLEGESFKVYEVDVDFSLFSEGDYYLRVLVDESVLPDPSNLVEYLSEGFRVAQSQPNTLLFEYKNSENNFSTIFYTDPVPFQMDFRVEAAIAEFKPVSDDEIYTDQLRNATLLNSVPFRQFKLTIGGPDGVPDWVRDKVNRILSCDTVQIDGQYYQKAEGAKWDESREKNYTLSAMSIDIMETDNRFAQRLKSITDEDIPDLSTMIQRSKNYYSNTLNITATGIFKRYSILEKVVVYAEGFAGQPVSVGTTPGGAELGTMNLDNLSSVLVTEWAFSSDTTVYVTGISGLTTDVHLVYLQVDDTTGSSGGGSPSTPASFVKGVIYPYHEVSAGDFNLAFDTATGLGREDTPFQGCALMGTNGLPSLNGRGLIGFGDYAEPGFSTTYVRGQNVGEAKHALTSNENGPHVHTYDRIPAGNNRFSSTGGGSLNTAVPATVNTGSSGFGDPHENRPPSLVVAFFQRITD